MVIVHVDVVDRVVVVSDVQDHTAVLGRQLVRIDYQLVATANLRPILILVRARTLNRMLAMEALGRVAAALMGEVVIAHIAVTF